jgi:bile acid-CoA:amino acid N-acyltransferase
MLVIFQIEKSPSAHFMFIRGEDDFSGDANHVKMLVERLEVHQSRDANSRYTVLSYPGAGHLIEPPYTPLHRTTYAKFIGQH